MVARAIAEYMYPGKGMKSDHVHRINCLKRKNVNHAEKNKRFIHELVVEKTKNCPRSLFVFDNLAGVPPQIFSDMRTSSHKAVFVFESSIGCCDEDGIASLTLKHLESGGKREDTNFLAELEALASRKMKTSELQFVHDAVSLFVPFIPLEHAHTRQCVLEVFCRREGFRCGGSALKLVHDIDRRVKFSNTLPIFAANGCKGVETVVEGMSL